MQNGRDHEEREQKLGTRVEQQERRNAEPAETSVRELDRRALSQDPAPTEKAAEEERARHEREGSVGGNVEPTKT